MKLFWNFIPKKYPETWAGTKDPVGIGYYIGFRCCYNFRRNSVGFIERQKDGSFNCYDGPTHKFLANEPSKHYAMNYFEKGD